MIPPKIRNFIKIKNISGVEKYVPGLKLYNVLEKGKEIEKGTIKSPKWDKDTKAPATKSPA